MTELSLRFQVAPPRGAAVRRALQQPGVPGPIRLEGSLVSITAHAGPRATTALLVFKLLSGRPSALFKLARQWAQRFDLRLDLGAWVAGAQDAGAPAHRAAGPGLRSSMQAQQALQGLVAGILDAWLPQLVLLAGTPPVPDRPAAAEPLHQFRVALRRLRCAARLLGGHAAGWNPAWDAALRALLVASGTARDQAVLQAGLLPTLRDLQAPLVALPAPARPAPLAPLLQSPDVGQLVLALLEFAHSEAPAPRPADRPVQGEPAELWCVVEPALKALRRRVARDTGRFAELDDAGVHKLRKRLKHLRYSLEFVAPLLPARSTRRYLGILQLAQESLGAWHDMAVAEALYRQAARNDPRAWFAAGWTLARKAALREQASLPLRRLVRADKPW